MGFFDFLSSSNNIETKNGLNEIYFDNGKSTQIKNRFTKKNGKREGVFEEFHKNGSLLFKAEYSNDLQHGLTQSFCDKGSLFRESKFQNDERIGITKEFYSDGSIRFEYDSTKHKYTFFSKTGKKTLIAYINISSTYVRLNFSTPYPEIYKGPKLNPIRSNSPGRHPFGIWKVFNENEEVTCEIDFKFFSNDELAIETVQNNYLDNSGKIISSQILDISEFNSEFFSIHDINKRKDELMDFDLRIDDVIKFKNIEMDRKRLEFFLKDSDQAHIYAFSKRYCAIKFMFEFMIENGGVESFKKTSNEIDVKYDWQKPLEFKNINSSIRLDYLKNKYFINQESHYISNYSAEQEYVITIESSKINNKNIINENDLEDIGIVSHYKGEPFTGTGHVLYEDGKIKIETQFKNGLKDGFQKVFYHSGQLAVEYRFSEDKLQKIVQRFLEDGTPMKKIDDFCIAFLLKKMSGIDNEIDTAEMQFINTTLSNMNFSEEDFDSIESQIKEKDNVAEYVNSQLLSFSEDKIMSLFMLLLSVMVADGEIDRREKALMNKVGVIFKMGKSEVKTLILKIDDQFGGKLLKEKGLDF